MGDPTLVPRAFGLSRSGVYFATTRDLVDLYAQEYTIQFLAFESGEVSELFRKVGPFRHAWLAVSPDDEWVLYSERPASTSELMLVENFR